MGGFGCWHNSSQTFNVVVVVAGKMGGIGCGHNSFQTFNVVVVVAGKMGGSAYGDTSSQGFIMQEGQMPGGMNYPQQGSSGLPMVG